MVVETPMAMDSHDLILLRELQRNGRATNVELANPALATRFRKMGFFRQLDVGRAAVPLQLPQEYQVV